MQVDRLIAVDRRAVRRVAIGAALVLAAFTAGGCGPKRQMLVMSLKAYAAQQSFVDTFAAFDSKAVPLGAEVFEGTDTVYELSRYQRARLSALEKRGQAVQRLASLEEHFDPLEAFPVSMASQDGTWRLDGSITVGEEGCCMWTLESVVLKATEGEGSRRIDFWSPWPAVRFVLIELPPTAKGRRYTWVLLDIREEDEAAKRDPR